ncbi:MAG TPA: DegT/DnrJ/EryC1/StrS family aminotransferase [Flavobacteriales bacterium]|nr:DegT/DnrJ/EryC1/StrS family aminotransferase [Flavobacteriales bacterium]
MPGTELFGEEEKKEVMDVLNTGVLFRYNHDAARKGHWKAKDFEAEMRTFTGAKHALAVSSGSTAVSTMLAACGVGYGDEVIVPPFTFIATIESVLLAGALPVFAEIDESLCMSAEGIKAVITPKTKAVLLVHMCGAAADLVGIMGVCKEHELMLIEDTAQALGATFKGTHLGLFGKMGSFSFDFFKINTCGEGGVIITDDDELIKTAEYFSDHGHNHEGDNRGMEPHPIMGTNYRMGEINAAIGLAQARKLPYILAQQRKHKAAIHARLSKIPGLGFRKHYDEHGDSATFFHLLLPDEAMARSVHKAMGEAGVGGAYWYDNMYHYIKQWDHLKNLRMPYRMVAHELGLPQDLKTLKFPKSDAVISRLVSFNIRVTWTEAELNTFLDKVEAAVRKVMEGVVA